MDDDSDLSPTPRVMSPELVEDLIAFRDTTIHAAPKQRTPLERAFRDGAGEDRKGDVVYRVCSKDCDIIWAHTEYANTWRFVSCCLTLPAAQMLLRSPPNPLADTIAKVTVAGKVIRMVYDDDKRRAGEEEILVPLKCIVDVSDQL